MDRTRPDQVEFAAAVRPVEALAMSRALDLALLGPSHGPNPRVGCVLLSPTGDVLAEGHHTGAGQPHAEAAALTAAAGRDLRGSTAVTTLEPCAHTGRTPPCAQALLGAGVTRVIVGAADPNPVAAGGAALLRDRGVEVVLGVLAEQSAALNRYWTHAVTTGRPFVTLKWASTLDGRVAAADGTSRWITGASARADVHQRRADADAVLVGSGTVLVDDPWLTSRVGVAEDDRSTLADHQPLRVVLGERDLPVDARVLDDAAPTLHLRTRDVAAALSSLADREVRHVFVEGGPTVAAAFLRAGVVDELLTYLAPAVLGAGPSAVGDVGVSTIAAIRRFRPSHVGRLGDDIVIVSAPVTSPQKETA